MNEFSLFVVRPDTPLLEAMATIDKNARGIAFVCEDYKLLATLSDGDIRRHIIKGGDLNCPVSDIANRKFKYFPEETPLNQMDEQMRLWEISCAPILREGRLVDIKILQRGSATKKPQLHLPVVIMAGGKGTRLYPYTKVLPKPLIPIGDLTITEHIMNRFIEYGCDNFTMIVNHKRNMIRAFFADEQVAYNVSFIDEETPLGTGGGLGFLKGCYDETFIVTNCDVLISADYGDILEHHRAQGNIVTMVCATKSMTIPYGTIEMNEDGAIMDMTEKPSLSFLTNTGVYIIEPKFFNFIPENTFIHITDIIQDCINRGERVGMYPVMEDQWSDMGQLEEMEKMKEKLEKI